MMGLLQTISWILFLVATTGAILNIKKKAVCFVFWGISNGGWAVYNLFIIHETAQGLQYLVFFATSVSGVWEWWGKEYMNSWSVKSMG